MDVLAWTVWGLAGAAYAATLILTTCAERRFMNNPQRWAPNGRPITVPPVARPLRAAEVSSAKDAGLQAPRLVQEVA